MRFLLSTDTSCDIFRSELKARGIAYRPLVYTIDDVPHFDECDSDADYKDFYDKIRAGKLPTTSQINVAEHEEFFESVLNGNDNDLIHITLSSGLSSTYESAVKAAEAVNERYGKTRVYVVDSLGATVVQRIVVDEAERLRDADIDAATAAAELKNLSERVQVWFMPTDLMHLKRGGRVSGPSAYIGTALNIKPILVINKNGGLSVVAKKMGMAKGMEYMLSMFEKYNDDATKTVYIPNCDNFEWAGKMQERLKALRPDCDVRIGWVGPVIGAHTGAGMFGVSFLCNTPREN